MKTWSVQLEGTLWTDDTYNGTFEECVEYCKNNGYQIGAGARLAEIEVREKGTKYSEKRTFYSEKRTFYSGKRTFYSGAETLKPA